MIVASGLGRRPQLHIATLGGSSAPVKGWDGKGSLRGIVDTDNLAMIYRSHNCSSFSPRLWTTPRSVHKCTINMWMMLKDRYNKRAVQYPDARQKRLGFLYLMKRNCNKDSALSFLSGEVVWKTSELWPVNVWLFWSEGFEVDLLGDYLQGRGWSILHSAP